MTVTFLGASKNATTDSCVSTIGDWFAFFPRTVPDRLGEVPPLTYGPALPYGLRIVVPARLLALPSSLR